MILIVSFPAICKSKIDFASLLYKPDPESKMKCDQLTELRQMVVKYMEQSLDHVDDLITSVDNYSRMFIETVPLLLGKGAKKPRFSWQTSLLKSAKEIKSTENRLGDFNLEVIMCLYLKATLKSVLAERILNELAKQMHPEIEQYKAAWGHIVDAAKITNFIASVGLGYLPNMTPDVRANIPELSASIMNGLSRLFVAESEMIAVEKGLMEKVASLTPTKITGIYKDIMNRLDEAVNFFEDGLNSLTSSAKSGFKRYYLTYCQAMRTCYEINYWYYYALTFPEDQRKYRLGCLEQCKRNAEKLKKEYMNTLPEHKAYMMKTIGAKEEFYTQEFYDNSKVYFETPADAGAIPPVNPIPFAPPLEFLPPGYMNMINAPTANP